MADNSEKAEVIEHLMSFIYYIGSFMLTFSLLQCETKTAPNSMLPLCFMCKTWEFFLPHMKINKSQNNKILYMTSAFIFD